jgi:hypothetical protein
MTFRYVGIFTLQGRLLLRLVSRTILCMHHVTPERLHIPRLLRVFLENHQSQLQNLLSASIFVA